MEADAGESIVAEEGDTSAGMGPDGLRKEPEVDKQKLAEKIVQILQKQSSKHSERHGR